MLKMVNALIKWVLAFIALTLIIMAGFAFNPPDANASIKRYTIAKSYIGLKEGTKAANKSMGVDTRRVPWCGYFISKVVKRAGAKPVKGYPRALSWKHHGRSVKISNARKGDIVVIGTARGHHVTIFSHKDKRYIYGIGGNQSNSVKLSRYRISSVRAVRR